MNPAAINLALAAFQAASALWPDLKAALDKGEVSPADQAKLAEAFAAIGLSGFTGPQWRIEPDPAPTASTT